MSERPWHLGYEEMERYVDGEADANDTEIVESHLRDCRQCAAEIDQLRQCAAEVRQMPEPASITATFAAAHLPDFERPRATPPAPAPASAASPPPPQRRRRVRWWVIAAILVPIVLVLWWWLSR